ncbi:MAG: hypothetical protein KGY54_14795, partial [Oleiphilaceae bacterium]|nr:hypothetical protein [Oleiphilaceae bacterium]
MVSEKAEGILLQAKGFVGVLGGEPEQHDGMKALQGPDFSTSKQGSCTFGVYSRNSANDSVDQENTILFTGSPFFQEGRPWDGSVAEYKALDGKFAIAKIAPQSVELATDVLGAGAVFYIYVKSHFFFASHLGLLLKVLPFAPALNPLGVAAQLYARAQLFDETHFSGIFRLAAGSVLTAEHELHSQSVQVKTTQRRGARSLLDIKAPTFGPDTLMTVLGRGVARYRFDEKSVLMLSGGRDSLAIALANERAPKHAVTYGDHS